MHTTTKTIRFPRKFTPKSKSIKLLSLDAFVAANDEETIYARINGDAADRGIYDGDLLVVHPKRVAASGDILLIEKNNTFAIKDFDEMDVQSRRRGMYLASSDGRTLPIEPEKDRCQIHGVVSFVLKSFQGVAA